MSRIHTKPRF